LGAFVGGGIGSLISYFYFEKVGLDFTEEFGAVSDWLFDPVIRGDFRIEHYLYGIIFGVILAVVSSIYPAWRASRMRPVDALRSI
jgi:ABC-type antimicrobial peptide transport system permease subunit